MNEGLIRAQAMATRAACARMTTQHLKALHDSVERASCLHSRSQWDRKAVAHTELFNLLADVTDDPFLTPCRRRSGACGRAARLAGWTAGPRWDRGSVR
jgi:DNA-binding GntR family transcriptional regulator